MSEVSGSKASDELKHTGYELFIAALSILSIANLVILAFSADPVVRNVIGLMDGLLSAIFLVDFLYRFFTADAKMTYFFRQFGWADLLASLPFPRAKLLRLFRLVRAGRMLRQYGAANLARELFGNRGSSALLTILFLMILVLEFGSMGMVAAERASPDANIKTANDALWYIYVTITTVGYGDRYPVTVAGRLVGIIVLTTGVGLFGTLTGFLANAFLAPEKTDEPAQEEAETADAAPTTLPAQFDLLTAKLTETQTLLSQQRRVLEDLEAKLAVVETWVAQTNINSVNESQGKNDG